MDKNAIKSFAIESRRQMIESVKYQASLIGITADGIAEPVSVANGMETYDYGAGTYSIYDEDIKKRESLVHEISNKGFENVIEKVAYTWFNRIIAIRYLEVNDYLPTRTRVLSSEINDKIEPDIVTDALELDLDYTAEDIDLIFKLKDENKLDELFQFLFIKQCNKLNEILPGLFKKTDDYMELLLNISFTHEDDTIRRLINDISEEDFGEQVEIIGWLYQYYNVELKDETFANLKKRIKIPKERVPAATQLFTPDWIVKYMVENSVGRLWLEHHSDNNLKTKWRFFIEESEQEDSVESNLVEIRKKLNICKPENIKIIDPCMGSGHVLVYVFDVLMDIYVSEGYMEKDASELILKNNICGLDIDDRAYQLAYFSLMMKARSYNRKIFSNEISLSLFSIQETNNIPIEFINFINDAAPMIKDDLSYVLDLFKDAKNYGSLLKVKKLDLNNLKKKLLEIMSKSYSNLSLVNYTEYFNILIKIIDQASILSNKYDVVITNPPYMGIQRMNKELSNFLNKEYKDTKNDLFASFIKRGFDLTNEFGFNCMVTMQSWMFLSSFKKLRKFIFDNSSIYNILHMDPGVMIGFGTCVSNLRNIHIQEYKGNYVHISNKTVDDFILHANSDVNTYISTIENFLSIPEYSIAYWINDEYVNVFKNYSSLSNYSDIKLGLQTGDNNKFIRFWYEINLEEFSVFNNHNNPKWFPHNKGGYYRKWFGNQDFVVNWRNDGEDIKLDKLSKLKQGLIQKKNSKCWNEEYYFNEAISWSKVSGGISFRYYSKEFLFDSGGPSIFSSDNLRYYLLGFLNSIISKQLLSFISPTMNFEAGHISSLPVVLIDNTSEIDSIVKSNISCCKNDWDDYETSWNFTKHPFLKFYNNNLNYTFHEWQKYKFNQFHFLKNNEIKLNELFAKVYSINSTFEIDDETISVSLSDYKKDVKSFISYVVGCMFGRYSLDEEGLQFAGGTFDLSNYSKFKPDDDNIIPVLDTEYFTDDIVGRFVKFVKVCFGEETLEENLDFIAGALKKKGKTSREIIRNYFLTDFFKDHVKMYNKCPIYWQFDSGKQNAFKCLIYMHRYDPTIVARVRTDYLHKTQKAIEQNLAHCDNIIANSSNKSEVSKATKDKTKYIKQLDEIKVYDEALRHVATQNIEIDLDDGVKVNYAKFQNVEVSMEGEKPKKINLLKKI